MGGLAQRPQSCQGTVVGLPALGWHGGATGTSARVPFAGQALGHLVFGMLAATAVGGTPARLCSPPSCGWCTWHWAALPLRSSPGPWSCSGHPRRGGPASSREPWNSGEQALRAPRLSQDGCGCFKERGAGLGLVLACVLRVRGGPGGPVPWRRFYWAGHNCDRATGYLSSEASESNIPAVSPVGSFSACQQFQVSCASREGRG